MFATTFECNYNSSLWGADGTVYMWVSKTHAARLESSNLSRPTKTNEFIININKNFVKKMKNFSFVLQVSSYLSKNK